MPRVLIVIMAERRVSISFAALLVKVTASTPSGLTCPVWISQAIRVVSTRVLPEPAPARISADSCGKVTAAFCSGFKRSNSASVIGIKYGSTANRNYTTRPISLSPWQGERARVRG